ncbi:hypothetical protein DFH09DRAFT_1124215 [Mycena vulgaris]|nr:hypothetical protein DFH09DRAFT_1124215 [Mycena vulgaris]
MRASILALLTLAGFTLAQSSSAATSKSAVASAVSSVGSIVSAALSSGSVSGSAAAASASAADVGSLSPCALGCINAAAANSSCGTFGNITCLCTDANFQFKAASCLTAECKAADRTAALGLQASQCGASACLFLPSFLLSFFPAPSSVAGNTGGARALMGSGAIMGVLGALGMGVVGALAVL